MTGRQDAFAVDRGDRRRSKPLDQFLRLRALAVMADEERTFGALERVANSAPQRLGRLLMTPELRVLRGDPRVVALRKKFGLP